KPAAAKSTAKKTAVKKTAAKKPAVTKAAAKEPAAEPSATTRSTAKKASPAKAATKSTLQTGAVRRYTVTDGIVIRRLPMPSGDLIVTLISEHGKWRAVARKGRLPGGNLGKLSLFHDVTVQYYRRKEEDLALLTQVQL